MFPLKHDHEIELEVLDLQERPIFCVPACLHDVHGELARLSASPGGDVSRLRWGSSVRFWIEGDADSYRATGIVIGIEAGKEAENANLTLTLRLWELRPKSQQRRETRRRTRLKLQYRFLSEETPGDPAHPGEPEWLDGKTLDLGMGGVRFRTEHKETPTRRIEVRFWLPEGKATRTFVREGNILRLTEMGRTRPALEIALKFDATTPGETLSLKRCF